MGIALSTLAQTLGAEVTLTDDLEIAGVAPLDSAGAGQVSFLSDPRYADQLAATQAAAVVVPADYDGASTAAVLLPVADVPRAMLTLLGLFAPPVERPAEGIAPTATVDATAVIGKQCRIGPSVSVGPGAVIGDRVTLSAGCVIGREVHIGEDCLLGPNVVVYQRCRIGRRVSIYANTTIGADGFGYVPIDGVLQKYPHAGIVFIDDDVEIGANVCIDRAKFGQTRIGPVVRLIILCRWRIMYSWAGSVCWPLRWDWPEL